MRNTTIHACCPTARFSSSRRAPTWFRMRDGVHSGLGQDGDDAVRQANFGRCLRAVPAQGAAGCVGPGGWMRPRSGMSRVEYARACACLRGYIPGGTPVARCATRSGSPRPLQESQYCWVVPGCRDRVVAPLLGHQPCLSSDVAEVIPDLVRRALCNLIGASLVPRCGARAG